MFEIKETTGEELMIGTFVDVYEFAKRWECFSTFQKAAMKANCYVGSLDDFALYVGYSAPMGMIYRKQLAELQKLSLINIADFNEKYYESHKDGFDHYDFEKAKASNYPKRGVKMFFTKTPAELANFILTIPSDKLPCHTNRNNRKIVRKNGDLRDVQNAKRKALHQKNK